jgi:GH15 family glucan-1,4-alpha-glucosidase
MKAIAIYPSRPHSSRLAYANDVGLLAKEIDPASGELLGDFLQAFSHIGLVNAAWAISQTE